MRRVLGLLIAVTVLGMTASARADDLYTVQTCAAKGPASGWTISNSGNPVNSCPSLSASAPAGTTGHLGGTTMTFTPPPATQIAAYSLWRTVSIAQWFNYSLFNDPAVPEAARVEACWSISQCSSLPGKPVSGLPDVTQSGLQSGGIVLLMDCNDASSNPSQSCPGGNPSTMRVNRFDVTLRDLSDPAFVGTPSGDLLDPTQPVAGVRTQSFSATDQGSGVYVAKLVVDGQVLASSVVDSNNGKCGKPFTSVVPCRLNASGSLSFDTRTIPDGVHAMSLAVYDATESNVVTYGPVQVRTHNAAAACDPAYTARTTPVAASLKGTKHAAVTRRSGRATIVGKVAGVAANATVALIARERRTGATATLLGSVLTAADGSFSLAVPPGPSRIVHAAFKTSPIAPSFACSRTLTIRVPATATLHASPRGVHPGARVRLYGKLKGGRIPARGKLIDLQARELGRWHTFAGVRTRRSGSFSTHYRFHSSAPRRTYPMRVRVRTEASYPYGLGYSRAVRVRVR